MRTSKRHSLLASNLVVALALMGATSDARAHEGPGGGVGLGLGIGAPTGLSLEVAFGRGSSMELAVGLNAFEDAGGYAHLVYKLTLAHLHRGPSVRVPFYLGVGGFIFNDDRRFDDGTGLGLRIPVGVNFDFQRAPVQAFVEIALDARLIRFNNDNARGLGLGAYAGVRWWF